MSYEVPRNRSKYRQDLLPQTSLRHNIGEVVAGTRLCSDPGPGLGFSAQTDEHDTFDRFQMARSSQALRSRTIHAHSFCLSTLALGSAAQHTRAETVRLWRGGLAHAPDATREPRRERRGAGELRFTYYTGNTSLHEPSAESVSV